MALSDYLDSPGGRLSEQDEHFLDSLPPLVYADTLQPFEGTPKRIIFSDPIQYFDELGRELLPRWRDKPEPRPDFLIEPKRD